jgi:2,4-dienoyl-CoA reductase-like NADH-dependent reductase (Old Yellow Enzyme family)
LPPDADLQPLWQPLQLRGVTLPNRVMCTATTLQYGREGLISDRHLAFYRERARGGVGLLFSEQLAASPLSDTAFPRSIRAYDERQVERFQALAAELEPYETRFFAQLVAGGAKGDSTGGLEGWGPLRGPSHVAAPGGEPPLPLDETDLAQLAADHARSAGIVKAGGCAGVEVHGAHGWLVGQFLSTFYNQREDEYGGCVANRCRLALELGRAIRAEVGDDFPVGIALTYDEVIGEAGITHEDTLLQLDVLAAAGVYDFFDLSIGAPHSGHLTISPMNIAEGYALPFGLEAKRVVENRAAVFVAGRVVSLAMAAQAVADGAADVVGMTRAHLADPHLVRKQGRETTRCVGANVCVGRALRGVEVACVLNPSTGREAYWGEGSLEAAAPPKQVVVLGAGPAGLRAAATAAARGHHVVVHERADEPGGHLRDLAWLPTRSAWLHAIEDLVAAVERNGGELRLGSAPESVEGDVVLLATGASWVAPDGAIDLGTALDRCRRDARALGSRVLIVDEVGTYAPLGLAEALAEAGVEVELATPSPSIGWRAAEQLELPHVLPRLDKLGVKLTPRSGGGPANGRTVVVAGGRVPRDELLAAFPDARPIGDARAPRTTIAVIYEAEEVARSL